MSRQKPILILALLFYVIAPNFFEWLGATDGAWYRPFIVWFAIIVIAYIIQNRNKNNDI